jgi:hypothetical protein
MNYSSHSTCPSKPCPVWLFVPKDKLRRLYGLDKVTKKKNREVFNHQVGVYDIRKVRVHLLLLFLSCVQYVNKLSKSCF